MSEMSLAQLRALAEAEDKQEASANAESDVEVEQELVEEEEESQEVDAVEEDSEAEDPEGEETTEDETEEWAKPDKGAVPVKKHVDMKHKLKAEIHGRDDEIARLKAENEALRKGAPAKTTESQDLPRRPMLSDDDIGYDDEKYAERMAEYTDQMIEHKLNTRQSAESQKSKQAQVNLQVQTAVDKHYERAASLVAGGKVTAENYQAADGIVRNAMESSLPGRGDAIVDFLIAGLGDGSEKVIYHLGANNAALSRLKECIKSDPLGFAASIYLGELKAKFNSASVEKPKQSHKPDKPLSGTAKTGSSALSKYKAAEKANDISGMLAAKRLAKEKKIDTSNW